jgi:hypothetical protein
MTTKLAPEPPVVIPVDDETRAMLNYAASPEGRARIDKARQEIRDGKGIAVTSDYFDKMNRRVAERVAKAGASKARIGKA